MFIRDTLLQASQMLQEAGCLSPRLDVELLLAHVLQVDRVGLYARLSHRLHSQQNKLFAQLLQRRLAHEPVAYLLGYKEFYGARFMVTPHVLVPRPETELLVDQALMSLPQQAAAVVIDVCTGSGCIGISIAMHRPHVTVWAVDISAEALQVAQRNARLHGVADRVKFVCGDLLQPCQHLRHVDCIVANPPYVRRAEFPKLPHDVRLYEPRQALMGECADGLGHHRRILSQAAVLLRHNARVLLEVSRLQQQQACTLQGDGLHRLQLFEDNSTFPWLVTFVKKEENGVAIGCK